MFKKIHILFFILLTLCLKQFAQTYPSGISTSLLPPYSIFIDEYANPLSPKIKASVVFTDFTEPSWDVYLKVKITGPNINIETKPNTKELTASEIKWYKLQKHYEIVKNLQKIKEESIKLESGNNENEVEKLIYKFKIK